MSTGTGSLQWFNGSRAALPAGHLSADGQTLNRADYPDLWNAISTGIFVSVTEANWQASAANRGMYSTGDGSTTFRMPDLNGLQSGSIKATFLRGDSGLTVGAVATSAIPNITGGVSSAAAGAFNPNISSGAFATGTASFNGITPNSSADQASNAATFDASRSSSIYTNGVTEVRPNSVAGIWLIRVNGKFSAANTNFNVFNGDTTLPASGTVVYGGDIRSVYQINGVDRDVARIRAREVIGGAISAEIGIVGGTGTAQVTASGALSVTDITSTVSNLGFTGLASDRSIINTSGGRYLITCSTAVITTNATGDATVPYSTAYSNAPRVVATSGDWGAFNGNISCNNQTTTYFQVRCYNIDGSVKASSAVRVDYIAIGRVA